ncbi:flagellin [Gracilibacillus lacisalsi]|uniref:flagellin N-terminal helical domain-containing protein n=1 Tax=Gracilibacillus lacisalsi TaxID=393087 RepID=UPI00036DA9E2|nr:flagellin [Gracilibacillus lacisalsi]
MAVISVGDSFNAMEKLSTAQHINSASDDPSSLAISEKMRAQIGGDNVAARNMRDSQSMLNTAEGALNASTSILHRMRELSVQANNSLLTESDRSIIQNEFLQLIGSLNAIGENTEYNTKRLIDGSLSDQNATTNANGDSLSIDLDSALASHLGDVHSGQFISSIDLASKPSEALKVIDSALEQVTGSRSSIGATTNRLDHAINVSENKQYNLSAAESRVRDADMTRELMEQNQKNILQQTYMATQKMQHSMAGQILNLFG